MWKVDALLTLLPCDEGEHYHVCLWTYDDDIEDRELLELGILSSNHPEEYCMQAAQAIVEHLTPYRITGPVARNVDGYLIQGVSLKELQQL